MAALAGMLKESGCRVTGSDGRLYPPTSSILERLGLEVHQGFDAAHLRPAPDLVVVGNAISRGNPEAEEVLDHRLRCRSMPELIAERFLTGRHSIVVAGTHGKTTTTAMLGWVLHHAGRDPGFLIGGLPLNFDLPFRLGRGPFVIEGDEYDTAFFDKGPKFRHYRPDTALLGTVEFDHADIYRDLEHVKSVFRQLTNLVPRGGLLVRHEDCPATREVSTPAPCRVEGYGLDAGTWRAIAVEEHETGCRFRIDRGEAPFAQVELSLGGGHNVRNALAAAAAAHELGVAPESIARALAAFRGVRRRLELRGEAGGVSVFDDFAHHPTAVRETLSAVRRRYPKRRIWAVLEPRSWSLRYNVFQERLAESFDAADEIVLAGVFRPDGVPEERRLDPERLVRTLTRRGRSARYLPEPDRILEHLIGAAMPGDVVVAMSNGGFGDLPARLVEGLRVREATASPR
jgi:UDP-N-acetylmuramate: L-alanyl-gamma-D-glutamyl-meso-diaminopimelate ligase